jgi:hypothetical protein
MKRILSLIVALAFLPSIAFAASQSSIPPKFSFYWGQNAGSSYIRSIPSSSQIGIVNCAASLNDGFPPLTFVQASAGGCPPFGQDFNGILRQLSQWNQWQAMGGPVFYDSSFASSIGGYPNGAIINSAITPGTKWMSTADNNATNPDAGGANWVQAPGQIPIGTPVQSISTIAPNGYVTSNGFTIGNASSNGTARANGDTFFLFVFLWNNCASTSCAIFTSAGAASVRSGTCTYASCADYTANKAIATPNMNGAGVVGADSMNGATTTFLQNVPVTVGSITAPGSIIGENLHVLTVGELATHNHTDSGHTHTITPSNAQAWPGTAGSAGLVGQPGNDFPPISFSIATGFANIQNTGSNTPHNTVSRSTVIYWNLKL